MFYLLLSSDYLNQGIFSVSCPVSEELHKNLGESTAGTANLKQPKGYSIP